MAENLKKRPAKGILKHSKSLDQDKPQDIKWDEMNILQTLHPADKDYGHMKIDEPKTPYSYLTEEDKTDKEKNVLDANLLAQKLQQDAEKPPKFMTEDSSSDENEDETEDQRAKRKIFEFKRKMHYNEFYAVKLARKLMTADDDDDEEEDDDEDDDEKEINENSNLESNNHGAPVDGQKNCTDFEV